MYQPPPYGGVEDMDYCRVCGEDIGVVREISQTVYRRDVQHVALDLIPGSALQF